MDGSLDFSVSGDTFPGGRTPAKAPPLKEGAEVEARYGGESEWFPGTIKAVNADGSYDIDYADGDKETKVIAEFVRMKQPPKTPLKRQDTEDSLKSTQKLKRAASEVEDKERADAKGASRNLQSAARELDSSQTLEASRSMRSAGEELQERKKQEAQRELEKQARREQEQAPEAIKEAARKVDGEKLSASVADLGRSASKYEASKEDPHAWMSSKKALPDKVEARTWSGLEAKATPELQAALPWDTSDIPTGNRPEVALLAERSLRRSRAPDAISRQQRVLLARSVDFSVPKKKLGPKFATISAHRLSKPIDRSTDVYGRTVKDVTNAAQKRLFKFASRDDALNCTFRPRLGKGDPLGEDQKEDEDNPNNFIQRQDAWGRKVRQDREHRKGEKEYGYVIDKKMCPSCGAVQKYDEIVNKRDRCPECAVAYKSSSAIKLARERELLGSNDAETCGKCGARQTLEELLDTRDTCAVCAIVYEELVMGGGSEEEEEESEKESDKEDNLEEHVGKRVKTPSGKVGKISRVEGDLCYVVLAKEEADGGAEAKEGDEKPKKKGSDDESEAKGSDGGSHDEAKGDDPLANVSPTKKSSRRRREKSNLSSDEENDDDDDASDGKGDAEQWVREQWPLMGRKGKETGGAEEGEDEFYFDELQLIEEKKSKKKKKKGSDDEYSSDEEAKQGDGSDAEAKADSDGDGSEAKEDEDSVKSKKKAKKKKKTKKRKVAKRKGPRTLLGRLRADARAQMTLEALLLRERSILQAEAGFLTVELRKLKRRRKLERAAGRRAAGTKVKDAIDADERAIVKALDDERKAAKAASVYESDPKRREALEAKVDEARAQRNAAFKHAVPALKERLDYNQACLDKCRRWRAKLSEKPDEPLHEEEEAKKEDPLMDKLREKGLGTFRERYQRTLDETETPELLDRKLRAIEQYRKEMEGQMRRKKLLTQKALRQKAEGKSDDEEDVDPLVAQRVEDELEKLDTHMEELREKIKGVQGEIESRRGDVQQRQEKRYKTYDKAPMKKVYDPETGETTEEPLFNADEGAFDNFIERREATLLKGETLAALELREQSLRRFEADLRKRTARKLRAERKREREEARAEAGSDAEEEDEDEDELAAAVEDALQDKLPDIEQRLADIEQRKEELAELEAEKEHKSKPKAPTKKAFVDGRIKDVPLYNPNKKAYVDPPQSGYLNFMSRQTEVVERATTAQTLKLRETALVRREKEMKKRTNQRRNEVKERERRQELEETRRERREERLEREEERKERLLEIHERNKEKREERAERAKEARARRREAFLRAADADDDGASLDAIEQEIETLERALEDLQDEREKVEEDRRNAEEDEREAREAASPVKHKNKSRPSDWAEFLGRREEAIERRTTRDSLALREKTLTTYELEITRRKEGKEKEIQARERRQKALEQRRERLERKREHAEELRDKVLARQEDQMKKRVERAERRAAAIERRKERDEDYDDDGSLADIRDEIDELDHALEDIREEREKARATRKAKVKEERRVEEEMRRKEKAAQTERVDARRRRKEEKKRNERRRRRRGRDSDSDSGSDRRRRRDSSSESD